jgi:hypothetical protein
MTMQLGDTAPDFTADATPPRSAGMSTKTIRVLDALQLSAEYGVSTPVNWNDGDDVVISPSIPDNEAKARFPKGFTTLKPYLRLTSQPNR